jgi:hypothetical protein
MQQKTTTLFGEGYNVQTELKKPEKKKALTMDDFNKGDILRIIYQTDKIRTEFNGKVFDKRKNPFNDDIQLLVDPIDHSFGSRMYISDRHKHTSNFIISELLIIKF